MSGIFGNFDPSPPPSPLCHAFITLALDPPSSPFIMLNGFYSVLMVFKWAQNKIKTHRK